MAGHRRQRQRRLEREDPQGPGGPRGAGTAGALAEGIETRIESLPATQSGFTIASIAFLRSRAEQRPNNIRAVLVEYRFRLLAA